MGGFGFPPVEQQEYRAPVAGAGIFELRPLSTGEILDRTFTLYRQRFWLYVGLSAVAAAVTTLGTFAQLSLGLTGRVPQTDAGDAAALARLGLITMTTSLVVLAVHLLAYSITQAATVSAVEANYLGRETSIGAAFSTVKAKWYRYLLVALWQGWSFVWPMLAVVIPASILIGLVAATSGKSGAAPIIVLMLLVMLPAFVVGFIFYLRNSLGIVACVSERLTVRQSMKRSKFLVADFKMRAFLIYLVVLALAIVAGVAQSIFNIFLIQSHGGVRVGVEIVALLVTFVSGSLVQPVGAIAFVLFYFDQRVRKEGFDVEMLMGQVMGVPPPPRAIESPFRSELGPAGDSPFGTPPDSPFRTNPGSPFPSRGDSPFSSGDWPGSTNTDKNG